MSIIFRQPTIDDAEALAELHVSSWRETYSHLLPADYFNHEYIQERHQLWHRILADAPEDFSLNVAQYDGEIIGFAFAGPSRAPAGHVLPRNRQLYSIYVASTHHGTGVGQTLIDTTLGDHPALLWVAKANARAVSFFQRNGFGFDGTQQINRHTPKMVEARMIR